MAARAERSVRMAVVLYGSLASLLPGEARRRRRAASVALFRTLAVEAGAVGGPAGVLRVFARSVVDLCLVLVLEWLAVLGGPLRALHGSTLGWLLRDVSQARRALLQRPSYALVCVLTLAIATGGTASMFALIDATMLRPLPYHDSGALHRLVTTYSGERRDAAISYPDFVDLRDGNRSFETLVLYRSWVATLGGDGPVRERGQLVSAGFFEALGIEPLLGRTFLDEEQQDGRDAVVMLSHGLWQRRFGGDAAVLGQRIEVNGAPHEVVGVVPERYAAGLPGIAESALWRPLGFEGVPAENLPGRGNESFQAVARLRAGVTLSQAQTDVAHIMAGIEQEHPDTNLGQSIELRPLQDHAVERARGGLLLLLAAVGFVLGIALVNVTNLMLGRASDRGQELAVRAALGAGRVRLVVPVLAESLQVAVPAGLLGLLFAVFGIRWLVANAGAAVPLASEVRLDARVSAFLFLVVLGAGLVAGLVAALHALRGGVDGVLRSTGRSLTAGRARARLSAVLVVSEVALSLLLVIGAGLFLRSFRTLLAVEPGFDADVITFAVDPPGAYFDTGEKIDAFYDGLTERVLALPGVQHVASISSAPLSGTGMCGTLFAREDPDRFAGQDLCAEVRAITPDYPRVMGIPIVAGRAFDERDRRDGPNVVLINEAAAALLWPGEDPIGRQLGTGFRGEFHEVVGVVRAVTQFSLSESPPPQTYLPTAQWRVANRTVVVRATAPASTLYPLLRAAVRDTDARVPVSAMQTMGDAVDRSVAAPRFRTLLLAGLGGLALLLAMVGIFGILSYSVAVRRREMAIRKSVGATHGRVLRLVLSDGLRLTGLGIAIGLAAAFVLTRLVASQLFRVGPTDPIVFLAVPALFLAVALIACVLPALRAVRVEATVALRE